MKNKKLLTQKSYMNWCAHYEDSTSSYEKYLKENEWISFLDWTFGEAAHACYIGWCGEDYSDGDNFRFPTIARWNEVSVSLLNKELNIN